jgi:hypothetical protein
VLRSGSTRQGSVWLRLHGSLTRPTGTHGGKEEAKAKIISAYGSYKASSFNSFGQPDQHDGDSDHIGNGASVFVGS